MLTLYPPDAYDMGAAQSLRNKRSGAMAKGIYSAVEQIKSNPDKEDEVRAWYDVGAELQKIGRYTNSSKIFGEEVRRTPMGDLPSSDRSDARWMFQNWKTVLQWIEFKSGHAANDPFRTLADLNYSHPSAIRRMIRGWNDESNETVSVDRECVAALQAAFESAIKRSGATLEISEPSIDEDGEGIEYLTQVYDPFTGGAKGRYLFGWSDISNVIRNPRDGSLIADDVWIWLDEMGVEPDGNSELTTDTDGRVHFRDAFED